MPLLKIYADSKGRGTCRSCGAAIEWAKLTSGKRAPFDGQIVAVRGFADNDGRVIEELGHYDPRNKDQSKQFVAKLDRCQYWLSVGAVPSETVSTLLKRSGIEHKSLRLPKPGKPKAAPVAAGAEGAKKEEAAPAAT